MKRRVPPKLKRLSPAKQQRLDELLDKNAEGTIAVDEKLRLAKLVAEAETLMVANAKRLAEYSAKEAPHAPVGAVPVTVWVSAAKTAH